MSEMVIAESTVAHLTLRHTNVRLLAFIFFGFFGFA